jgi:hypothetical protein
MPPDVSPVFWGVGNPSIGNPAVRVQPEDAEGTLHCFSVPQFDLVTPLDEVEDNGWFNLSGSYGVPISRI